jgi:DNA-binding transcriptional LysR family regulator
LCGRPKIQTKAIVNLVAAELGVAIVPSWTSRMTAAGVRYIPLIVHGNKAAKRLPLAAAWARGFHDPIHDEMCATLRTRLNAYAEKA